MITYDEHLVEQIAHTLDLRAPNRAALDALARSLDGAPRGTEIVVDLATGVGKTYIAGGLLDYLEESGVRNVVIVTPGSTIQNKTLANLTPGHPKYIRGLQSNPMVITLDSYERGEVARALEDPDVFKVFVFTVQSLLRPSSAEGRRAHRPHETVGQALSDYLARADDLVVIADEHHVYASTGASKFSAAIAALRPAALIGLTATPLEGSEPFVVYRYPLSDAIADGYVKIPVLVSRTDGAADVRTQLADGLALLDVKAAAMRSYSDQTRRPYVEPILFVVASTIDEASEIRDLLSSAEMLGDERKVLLVTSDEPDRSLALLDTLEDQRSPIRAVVSVSMLKEGWDVKNIYVVASTRALESELLTEQVLGRGLRLPFGMRTGNAMLDTVEVLSHRSFAALLREAKVLLAQTLGERSDGAAAVADPTPGIQSQGILDLGGLAEEVGDRTEVVDFTVPEGHVAQGGLFDDEDDPASWGGGIAPRVGPQVGLSIATMGARIRGGAAAWATKTYRPREAPGVQYPLFLPRVTSRVERDPFSLTMVNLVDVESLGRQFASDNGASLVRKTLDARRESDGHVELHITEGDRVAAAQLPMAFDTVETDLVGRLIRTNGVAATAAEINGAVAIARAFLRGAGVTETTPWREEHGRLASTRLTEWISARQRETRPRLVHDVTQVRWPEPPERIEARQLSSRHLVTSRAQFERAYPYDGWERSIYPVNAFDAYSTEFQLAVLFDASPEIATWARIDQTVPLRITYRLGAAQREYEPDFLVIDSTGRRWVVEGKADDRLGDDLVQAKAAAAREWVAIVNAADNVQDTWGYLLASESVIAASSSWPGLKAGASTYA